MNLPKLSPGMMWVVVIAALVLAGYVVTNLVTALTSNVGTAVGNVLTFAGVLAAVLAAFVLLA